MTDERTKVDDVNEDEKFFEDVLDDPETKPEPGESKGDDDETEEEKKKRLEEEQRQKNKDAEMARKRREAEAKAEQARKEKEAKEKEFADKKAKAKEEQLGSLGKQLDEFKKEFPDIDLKELDQDKQFKKFITGRLLGNKHFTDLYKEYEEMKSNFSGKTKEEIQASYKKKAESGSGSSVSRQEATTTEIFTEEEFAKIQARIPYMTDEEYDKIVEKFDRSYNHYSK